MDITTILQAIADFETHQWWPLALLVILWVRKLTSADSKFPVTIQPRFLPLVTSGLTVLTVFATSEGAGKTLVTSLLAALVAGVGAGFFDGMLTAIFGDPASAPGWAKTIVGLIDEVVEVTPTKTGAILFLAAGLCFSQAACISSAPTVPVTPQNQAQISTCQSTATEHNGFVLGGIVTGATSTALGGVALAEGGNTGVQQALGVASVVTAGVAAVAAGGAGLTAASFTNGRCTDVVAPLPMKPSPTANTAWPIDWPPPTYADDITSAESVMSAAGAR